MRSWAYRRPPSTWAWGRDKYVVIGAGAPASGATAPTGSAVFVGRLPTIVTDQTLPVTQPILRRFMRTTGGVHYPRVQISTRITLVESFSATIVGDVVIGAPAGTINWIGYPSVEAPGITVPLAEIAYTGQTVNLPPIILPPAGTFIMTGIAADVNVMEWHTTAGTTTSWSAASGDSTTWTRQSGTTTSWS